MSADLAFGQKPKGGDQAADGHGNEQVNPGKLAADVDFAANEQRGQGCDAHHRDPGVAEGAMQLRALRAPAHQKRCGAERGG